MATTTPKYLDPCISGYGIVCGLEVHVNDDCSIEVQAGTAITPAGQTIHLEKIKKFNHYYSPTKPVSTRAKSIQQQLNIQTCYELSDATFNAKTMDSLKQQYQSDLPEHAFLHNKILLLSVDTNAEDGKPQLSFWLAPLDELAKGLGIQSAPMASKGLFTKAPTRTQVDPIEVDRYLRPVLSLPSIKVPRFGYKTLAITDKANVFKGVMVNPFSKIDSFQLIFSEYKAILDDLIPDFSEALERLHTKYSPLFTHKYAEYLDKFPKVLEAKWAEFCKRGKHLYYIQYFYDWLRDLVKAYEELRLALTDVRLQCICEGLGTKPQSILLLGPVLGGRSSHQPLVFRDAFTTPFGQSNREAQLQHIKCLHWRLMMMIWTFDLPFLQMQEVLAMPGFSYDPGNEEKFDSTNYWEAKGSIDELPIVITPSHLPYGELGAQAIPYYYPLDGDSSYSVHRYWNPHFTKVQRIDEHRSYNVGDAEASTKPFKDGYSSLDPTVYPLCFDLQGYPYLKVEGHIGKQLSWPNGNTSNFYFTKIDFLKELKKSNFCLDVIALPLNMTTKPPSFPLEELLGLEHQQSLIPGQTLVLIYTEVEETIDLKECNDDPKIDPYVVVADFVLPYRYTCCKDNPQPAGLRTLANVPPPPNIVEAQKKNKPAQRKP
ncbi:hypothetical protein [Haliscomenobacter sp.]|uniref:hypothetical protein n=1 Tax=Haliscomenobacter sp. TaxID=2717303 RepID=UPI0035934F35